MSIDVAIRQSLFGKKTLPLEIILGGQLAYGDYRNDCLKENVLGETEFVAYDPARIGRGFSVVWTPKETRQVELRLLQPSTREELSAFYDAIRRIAEYWGGSLTMDGSRTRLSAFLAGFENAVSFNNQIIQMVIDKILSGDSEELTLHAAKWALVMGQQEAFTFSQNPAAFGAWLHEKQSVSAFYGTPRILSRDDAFLGVYACEAGHSYIFPQKPAVPFGIVSSQTGKPIETEDVQWVMWLDEGKDGGLCQLPYTTFLERVPTGKKSYYDPNHFSMEPLTEAEIREIGADAARL